MGEGKKGEKKQRFGAPAPVRVLFCFLFSVFSLPPPCQTISKKFNPGGKDGTDGSCSSVHGFPTLLESASYLSDSLLTSSYSVT